MLCVYMCHMWTTDDIEVVLYEDKQENSGNAVNMQPWSAKGRFGPNDVHHQVSQSTV